MYSQGEYVAYGMTGVCVVEGLTEMAIPGTKDMKSYYVLKPVYEEKGVIYCPVSNESNMRRVLTKEEADELIASADELPVHDISAKKTLDEACKTSIATGLCREYMIVLKTLVMERNGRIASGKKLTATNERFLKICMDKLCGELAIAYDADRRQIEDMVKDVLDKAQGV